MKVIGLDPASSTGACFADGTDEKNCRVVLATWKFTGSNGAICNQLQSRLRQFIVAHGCDLLCFEDASFGSINKQTQAFHNALRGAIEAVADAYGIKTRKYHPSTIKKNTADSGRATKDEVRAAVKTRYGITCRNTDESDAAAIAMMGIRNIELPSKIKKAKAKRIKKAHELQNRLW